MVGASALLLLDANEIATFLQSLKDGRKRPFDRSSGWRIPDHSHHHRIGSLLCGVAYTLRPLQSAEFRGTNWGTNLQIRPTIVEVALLLHFLGPSLRHRFRENPADPKIYRVFFDLLIRRPADSRRGNPLPASRPVCTAPDARLTQAAFMYPLCTLVSSRDAQVLVLSYKPVSGHHKRLNAE
jgi:hypothetical protein